MSNPTEQNMALVTNLPNDATEKELRDIMAQVGNVIRFRIFYNKQTGAPIGKGICEFDSSKLVDSAVRNLDGIEYKGHNLMVRRFDSNKNFSNKSNRRSVNNNTSANNNSSQSGNNNSLNRNSNTNSKNLKKKVKTKKSMDEITRVVKQLTTNEKKDILSQMKQFIVKNETKAKEILNNNPQLAQALLLIQLEFGLILNEDIIALTEIAKSEKELQNPNINSKDILMTDKSNQQIPQQIPIQGMQGMQGQIPNIPIHSMGHPMPPMHQMHQQIPIHSMGQPPNIPMRGPPPITPVGMGYPQRPQPQLPVTNNSPTIQKQAMNVDSEIEIPSHLRPFVAQLYDLPQKAKTTLNNIISSNDPIPNHPKKKIIEVLRNLEPRIKFEIQKILMQDSETS